MVVKNSSIKNSNIHHLGFGPLVVSDCQIENVKINNEVLFVSGCSFNNVKLKGYFPATKFYNAPFFQSYSEKFSREIECDNTEKYKQIKLALDQSEAKFDEVIIVGIPKEKIIHSKDMFSLNVPLISVSELELNFPDQWMPFLVIFPKDEPGKDIVFSLNSVGLDQEKFQNDVMHLKSRKIIL